MRTHLTDLRSRSIFAPYAITLRHYVETFMQYRYVNVMKFLVFVFVILCCVPLVGTPVSNAMLAATPENPCVGLDIAIIIDQSNSMISNDVSNFRVDSTREIIHQLGDNRLYLCPDAVHRIAVISFGDQDLPGDGTEVDLDFVDIKPDRENFNLWVTEREQLKARIQPKELGGTDFATAFAVVKQKFNDLAPIGTLPRKQAIILLTDGGPCVIELGCSLTGSTFSVLPYLRNLQNQVDQDFHFQPGVGYYLWIVAMHDQGIDYLNDQVGDHTLRDYWNALATARGGSLIQLTKNREDIPVTFYKLLKQVTGSKVELTGCTPTFIEPYTERAIFTIFKSRPTLGASVEHRLANGQVVLLKDGKVTGGTVDIGEHTVDGAIERYVVKLPDPGLWTVTSDNCTDLQIYREIISPNFELVKPTLPLPIYDQPPFYDPRDSYYLTYEMRGRGAQVMFNQPMFPLTVKATITNPLNDVFTRTMVLSGTVLQSTEPLLVKDVGEYRIKLVGETLSIDPSQKTPNTVFTQENSYRVFVQVQPFEIKIVQPEENGASLMQDPVKNTPTPAVFILQLVSQEGHVLDPGRVFTGNPAESIAVTVTNDQGVATPVPVNPSPNDSAIFTSSLDLPEGTYTIQATVQGAYRQDRFQLVRNTVRHSFKRIQPQFFSFKVLDPVAGSAQPMNSVDAGQERPLPLSVRVMLVDAAGLTLDPSGPYPDLLTPIFKTTLQRQSGEMLNLTLQPDPAHPGLFQADIADPGPPGAYQLTVSLARLPTNIRLQPLNADLQQITFVRVRIEPFDFKIISPDVHSTQPLHVQGFGAAFNQVVPLPVVVEIRSATGQGLLDPQSVLADNLAQAIQTTVVSPDGITHTVSLSLVERPDGKRLEGTVTDLPGVGGDYNLAVKMQSFKPGFAPLHPTQETLFTRQDKDWGTYPLVWRVICAIPLLLLIGLLWLLWWAATHIPRGELKIVSGGRGGGSATVMLRWYHLLLPVRNSELQDLGIGKIKVIDRSTSGENAVEIWVRATDGQPLIAGECLSPNNQSTSITLSDRGVATFGTLTYS